MSTNLAYLIDPLISIDNVFGQPIGGGYFTVSYHDSDNSCITYKDFNGTVNDQHIMLSNRYSSSHSRLYKKL
nr:MAG TPA_asm: hypothetical protein [Caudoviricetes sp.]